MGGVEMLLFQGAGGRIPHSFSEPFIEAVWPLWTGQNPHPDWRYGERFCRNAVSVFLGDGITRLGPAWEPIQFLPLVVGQLLSIGALTLLLRQSSNERNSVPGRPRRSFIAEDDAARLVPTRSNLGVDQQQDGRRRDQDPRDP
jgi:hypothetical protein